VERNVLAFNNIRWDIKKILETIWQGLPEYARHARDVVCKEVAKEFAFKDLNGDHDKLWGGNELLYHYNDNNRTMHRKVKAPNVGLVNHALGCIRIMVCCGFISSTQVLSCSLYQFFSDCTMFLALK
jgi:hypothetical protein